MLNELDHELERRGHHYIRYADDMVILCGSKASAGQTLEHIVPYIERKLFLKVNQEKTVAAYAGEIKFLGYGFYKNQKGYQPRVHGKSKEKMKAKVKRLTGRRYHNLEKLGISDSNAGILANSRKGYWRIAGSPILNTALTNERLEKDGFQYFFFYYKSVTA